MSNGQSSSSHPPLTAPNSAPGPWMHTHGHHFGHPQHVTSNPIFGVAGIHLCPHGHQMAHPCNIYPNSQLAQVTSGPGIPPPFTSAAPHYPLHVQPPFHQAYRAEHRTITSAAPANASHMSHYSRGLPLESAGSNPAMHIAHFNPPAQPPTQTAPAWCRPANDNRIHSGNTHQGCRKETGMTFHGEYQADERHPIPNITMPNPRRPYVSVVLYCDIDENPTNQDHGSRTRAESPRVDQGY
jgi:hypothetical protein